MMTKINPCPFCGSENINMDHTHFSRQGTVFFMECYECESRGPCVHFDSYIDDHQKIEKCIELWNKRFR